MPRLHYLLEVRVRRVGALLVAALALVMGAAGAARADVITQLPISNYYQMVVDSAHGHIFISQGSPGGTEVLVTNLSGQKVATIPVQNYYVMGLALSSDGRSLYAALPIAHEVMAISTATLKQTAAFFLPSADDPENLAFQSGKVWVSYSSNTSGHGAIGDINLSASPPAFETQAAMSGWLGAPTLAADPSDTGVLVAAGGIGSATSYNVSVDPATVTATNKQLFNCNVAPTDLALAPGGKEVVIACSTAANDYRYSTATLTPLGYYSVAGGPANALAIAASGTVAAGAKGPGKPTSPASPADLYVFHQDTGAAFGSYDLWATNATLAARGLAWSADGSRLFAVTYSGSFFSLHVFYPPLTESVLTISPVVSGATYGKPTTITGSLSLVGGTLPSGTTFTITRALATGGQTKQFTVPVAADGSWTLTDMLPTDGKYVYTAAYAGSASIAPATASMDVYITGLTPALTVAVSSTTFDYAQTVTITAHLGTTYTNRTVSIYAEVFGSTTETLLKSGTVDSSGNLTATVPATYSSVFSAVFTGDTHYASATAKQSALVRVALSESQSGYYGTRVIHGITYRLYHKNTLLNVSTMVAPNKVGERVCFKPQEFLFGTWYDVTGGGCATLDASSKATMSFSLTTAAVGQPYRIRADFQRSSSDPTNLNNDSAWQYFIPEK